jgi:hypothetical protein
MKTVDFGRILTETIQLCGLDVSEVTVDTFIQMRDFASNRLKMAWEYDKWPDLTRYEERTVQKDSNVSYLTKPSDASEVFAVWDRNPNETTRAMNLDFKIVHTNTEERLVFKTSVVSSAWLEYRIEPVTLTGTPWNSSITYYAGSQVAFDSGSNSGALEPVEGRPFSLKFYNCIKNNTNTNPSTNTENWVEVKIPYIFTQYIARGVFADYLRSEGQFESAMQAEQEAKYFLDIEIDKLARQQSQVNRINFIKSY